MTPRPSEPTSPGAPTGRPPAPRTVGEMQAMARGFLERRGLEEARLEADLLVAHALGTDRLGLLMRLEAPVQPEEVDRARDLLVRRGRLEPVAYIVGSREFYSRPFLVGVGVLVPRADSELLVDLARTALGDDGRARREAARRALRATLPDAVDGPGGERASGEERESADGPDGRGAGDDRPEDPAVPAPAADDAPRVLDVGTGSGCLAITVALECPWARVEAVDVSPAALDFARRNAEALGAAVAFHEGDGLERLEAGAPYDLVLSNPPYVRADDPALTPEVREHEPALALFAPDGDRDRWVRELCRRARRVLRPGGTLLVELGHDQGAAALELARAEGLEARLHRDLAGVERVLEARVPDGPAA